MTNGFGSGFVFGIDDNANSIQNMARIAGVRDGADNTGKLVFDVATTGTLDTKMTILNNGNVGIGTTSPSELLELSKSTSYQLRLTNLGTGSGYWNIGQTNNNFSAGGGKLVFVPDSTSSNAATVTFTNTGKVGIGTTSPATSGLLDLTSTTGALIVPRMTTTQRNALTAVNGMIIYNTTTNTMQGRINGAWTDM